MGYIRTMTACAAVAALMLCSPPFEAIAARIKDIATIDGATSVQVIGYGLVTGVNNQGDRRQSTFTVQSVASMLKRFGITVPQETLNLRNVAAVMVTASVPTFMKKGQKFDVQVSSLGDAQSLQGGILLMTPLIDANGSVLAMAQGALTVGGFDFQSNGSRAGRNLTTSGRVPTGGLLEQDLESEIVKDRKLRILLRDPDFTTAVRISEAINRAPGLANSAEAVDAASVSVQMPTGASRSQIMSLIARIEALDVAPDPVARVVINERTGTIVVGGTVQLLPAVVSHGGLDIRIQSQENAIPPPPFTILPPSPVYTRNSNLEVTEEMNPAVALPGATTVEEMANALNKLKVSPRDLIAIFQALHQAGALQAELVIQ